VIARIWTGATRTEDAEAYEAYMHAEAMPGYRDTPGNRAVFMLRRDLDNGRTEFTMVTVWDDIAAVEAFTGPEVDKAVFFAKDEDYLVERDLVVRHYDVYGSSGLAGL
jgi:heme-degrading monooxygenase HmoA